MTERCIACGMPMETPEDHAGKDVTKDYCRHCARPDGTMQSYQERLDSLTSFISRTEGLSEDRARTKAKNWMARQPAWQDRQPS